MTRMPQIARHGSIPARAGEPIRLMVRARRRWVYPRACGGTETVTSDSASVNGLSPRVRGNLVAHYHRSGAERSIPARAGEPPWVSCHPVSPAVYPRACGGTGSGTTAVASVSGLSPRVRGNPLRGPSSRPLRGSIPARAGEPDQSSFRAAASRVYPRACGGTYLSRFSALWSGGLSPRVRGNQPMRRWKRVWQRSIPARAGEPTL